MEPWAEMRFLRINNAKLFITILLSFSLTVNVQGQPLALREEDIPQGAASLAFVFDITGSMYDDLVQVIEGAAKILATTKARREKPLYNYVLVPFHDPDVGPVVDTRDDLKFQRELRDLYVQGGGDCPEMSITAIQMALQVSLPNSFIYVFTDARSKDYEKTSEVLTLIQQKQSQVVFVMTGDCGNTSHPGYQAYEQIASTSSGQVFLLKKSEVNQVLNFVRVAVQSRKVNLFSSDRANSDTQDISLPIDTELQEFTISISGDNPDATIINPAGQIVTRRNGRKELLNIKNVLIINIKDPEPGLWRVKMSAKGKHTTRITGLSSTDFIHGFSKKPTDDLVETRQRPVSGIPTYLLLNATGMETPGRFTQLELLDLHGETLAKYPVHQHPEREWLYNVSAFVPPANFFYLRVKGVDSKGFGLQRLTPTAISPSIPVAPIVYMPEITRGHYKRISPITCYVTSEVPFYVQFYWEDTILGTSLYFSETANATWSVKDASAFSEGVYRCNATSIAGSGAAETYFDVTDPPPYVTAPSNVTTIPGRNAILTCEASSTVEFNMTWYNTARENLVTQDPDKYIIHRNGSLQILNVRKSDEGPYICRAANEGGNSEEKIYLIVQVAPVARVRPESQPFKTGQAVSIQCTSEGSPASYIWRRKQEVLPLSEKVNYDRSTGILSLKHLQPYDEGAYECLASNPAGSDTAVATLRYIEAPIVQVPSPVVLVSIKESAKLSCDVHGIPKPNITWFKEGIQFHEFAFVEIMDSGDLMLLGVQEYDAGEYTCVATNEAGTARGLVTLEVGSQPKITRAPSSVGIDIETNGTLPCKATGYPPPKILWRREDGLPIDWNGRFRQMPSGSLFIQNIQASDEGAYVCSAQNQFGVQEVSAYVTVSGIVRPLIAFTNPLVQIIEGRPVRLTCFILLGNPKPKISWLKGDQVIEEGNGFRIDSEGSLHIESVRAVDEGDFKCHASNVGGNSTYITQLDVQVPPVIDKSYGNEYVVVQGNRIVLHCEVQGDPPPSLEWFKNGVKIPVTDSHYFISESGNLEIFSADPKDTSSYSCSANNIAGSDQRSMTLFVQVPPMIMSKEDKLIVEVNNPVLLPCEVHAIPDAEVRWYKDGGELSRLNQLIEIRRDGLYMPSTQVEDAGLYECEASNVAGTATKRIKLVVQVPPKIITEGPSKFIVIKGDHITLPCEATGDPDPMIMWRKNGKDLTVLDADDGYIVQESGALYIVKTKVKHTATYTCIAENPAGSDTRSVKLVVHDPPQIPEDTIKNTSIIENQKAVLPCPATGTPLPKITWYKNGKEITGNELGVRILADGSLVFDRAEASDAGSYECVASNVAGNISNVIEFRVFVPPRIGYGDGEDTDGYPHIVVIINQTAILECLTHAIPPPTITWYKADVPLVIENEPRLTLLDNGQRLRVAESQLDDTALYRCQAENIAGKTEKKIDLEIQEPPRIDETRVTSKNNTVIVNDTFEIDCPVIGTPKPLIVWFKDGEVLDPSKDNIQVLLGGKKLRILSAEVEDTGDYQCKATNVAGETKRNYKLEVHVPPKIDDSDEVAVPEVVLNRTIVIICPASGIPIPEIAWFKDGNMITQNTSRWTILANGRQLEVRQAQVSDTGRFQCRAKNVAGESEKYFDLTVLVPPYIDKTNIIDKPKVVVNQTITISCPANGIPDPEIVWLKNGELLNYKTHPDIKSLSNGRQLEIRKAKVTDTAVYRCLVMNKAGEDFTDFTLQVLVPAYIGKRGVDEKPRIIVNNTFSLSCPAAGIPTPDILWLKDGFPIRLSENPNIQVHENGLRLEIRDSQVDDTGRYTCRAVNEAGDAEQDYDVQIWVPPTIDKSLIDPDPNVIVNNTIVIDCPAEGIPTPKITWLRNGQQFDTTYSEYYKILAGGLQLEISNAQVSDEAMYICIAENDAGRAHQEFELDVWVPPYFPRGTELSSSHKVIKDYTTVLHCPVMGHPEPTITWLKERQTVEETSRIHILNGGRQLEIMFAKESDTAGYVCIAENVAGQAKKDFQLHVLVPPSIDRSNIVENPKVIVNRTVILECPVKGIPKPEVEWLKNGRTLEQDDHVKILSDSRQIDIMHAQESDTARYTCIASNEAGNLRQHYDLEVLVPPSIDDSRLLKKFSVIQNRTVFIECPAVGIPPPSILWLKNREPLLDFPYRYLDISSNGQRLQIRNTQVTDAATYTCIATNVAGQLERKFQLEVYVPPVIVDAGKPPQKLNVVVERPISIECIAEGIPPPTIRWFKGGEEMNVDADPHITIHTNGRVLEITSAQVKDTSSYTCRAENPAGMAERHYILDVYVPPSINGSERLEQLTVTINRPIAIKCPAEGIPSPRISWERESIPISPLGTPNIRVYENGRRLQILSAQLREIGSYACIAVNPAGRAIKNFDLDVQVPPTIEDGQTEVASIVDTRTTLECQSVGLPDPEVTWTKDGTKLSFDTGAQLRYRMHKSGNLEFAAVKVADEGEYTCTASNPAGQVSRRINLSVYVPPSIERGEKEKRVLVKNTVILPCKATGTPKPIISWQKGAALQTNSIGFREILSNGSLKIENARVSDSGMYICIAQNTAGTILAQTRLEVLVPPFIEEQQTEFKVIQGHGLIMPCKSIGVPKPKIIWEKDGVEISPTDFSFRQIRSGGLAIPITKAQDSGTFTCIAENVAGRASVTMDLVVQVSPTITGDQRIFVVIQGETAMLPCVAEGIPSPQIQWMKDFSGVRDLEGKYKILSNGTLRIENVKEQDQGSYVCRADNEAGKDSREVLLRVQIGPSFTVIPQDQEVTTGGRIQLECEAVGMPTPVVTWSVNGSYLPAAPSVNGRSRLVIDNAMKDDDGTYTCEAENPAGKRKVVAAVRVKVPPKILLPPGNRAVTIAQRIILSCPVSGDPAPTIIWTKNGRPVQLNNRVQQLSNGSLIIYDSTTSDAGEYKCVATNDAGTSESSAFITIRKAPDFKLEPKDIKIDQGATLVWDCVAESEPAAEITWKRETPYQTVLSTHDRITILQNNSLRIVATQLEDSALYTCLAKNPLGRALVQAQLTVVVHGMFSSWSEWSDCSVSCGQGIMYRERACDNPKPANGGRECVGETRESRRCLPRECAVDGSWSNWSQYESCSATCGVGYRQRSRRCDNPPPQFGGRSCFGDDKERVECSLRPCPVDGDWSSWSPWQPCSQTCGTGMQERYRDCNSPRAEHGGKECVGDETERRRCKIRECEIHGNWGGWAPWTVCSRSCNGGTKSRSRRCDSPAPSYGGRYCLGRDTETDYCNTQGCPIHGNWSPWGGWGDCTAECGGGYQKRFRTCGNPAPSNGGRACPGNSEEAERCNEVECPVDGQWSRWSDWSKCTQTCGGGEQKRTRSCSQPRFGGKHCLGDETQIQKCNIKSCGGGLPTKAMGNIIGNVNDIDFGVSTLIANITPSESGTIVTAKLHNIPRSIGRLMEHLISILTPIYWTTALEVGEAVNGYTLTKGEFRREVQVEFSTGEILRMIHIARGMDSNGELQLDIVVNGYVPQLPPSAIIKVEPYEEEYIQTAPGAIYAYSTRMFKIGNYIIPYAWNHTITYDAELGKMPYLVQKLFADDLTVKFEPSEEVMRYQLSARIAKGTPSNKCPKGFFLDPEGPYCRDDDECVRLDPCSHYCHNSPGSFSCSCPLGLRLGPDGRTCKDIDECDTRIARCHRNQECVNTIGSYRCMVKCGHGFRRTSGGLSCQDINECRDTQNPCDQTCLNLIGSFRCRCKHGYRLVGRTKCIDVDECKQSNPCSHQCVNTPGSYECSCPGGFELVIGGVCRDIDECAHNSHNCRPDEDCHNTQGSFQCVKSCPKGFEKAANGTCIDQDECTLGLSRCHYNQKCINSYGGYTCTCPRGYRSDGPGKPCVDINECAGPKSPCTYQCRNIPGNFECLCPPGMKRLADKKSCAGLEFLDRGEVLNVIGSPYPSNQYNHDAYTQSECQPGKPCALSGGSTLRVACPVGFRYDRRQERCVDYDECQQQGRCQHKCQNTEGSYRCLCPPGYKLSSNKRTCIDIDECKLKTAKCDPKQICFNRRGDYTCIDTVCPDNYKRDPITGDCVLECSSSNQPCPTNSRYADILQVRTVSLPSGIPAYQDLIRLIAYNQYGVQLPNTYFDIIENDPKIPFQIRLTSDGKGVVYTIRPLERQATYKIKVRARSFDHTKRHLMYRTTFLIHIAVSAFPY